MTRTRISPEFPPAIRTNPAAECAVMQTEQQAASLLQTLTTTQFQLACDLVRYSAALNAELHGIISQFHAGLTQEVFA